MSRVDNYFFYILIVTAIAILPACDPTQLEKREESFKEQNSSIKSEELKGQIITDSLIKVGNIEFTDLKDLESSLISDLISSQNTVLLDADIKLNLDNKEAGSLHYGKVFLTNTIDKSYFSSQIQKNGAFKFAQPQRVGGNESLIALLKIPLSIDYGGGLEDHACYLLAANKPNISSNSEDIIINEFEGKLELTSCHTILEESFISIVTESEDLPTTLSTSSFSSVNSDKLQQYYTKEEANEILAVTMENMNSSFASDSHSHPEITLQLSTLTENQKGKADNNHTHGGVTPFLKTDVEGLKIGTTQSQLALSGGEKIIDNLIIANGGCTAGQVQLAENPALSAVNSGDLFIDDNGDKFIITAIDTANSTLSFTGTCTQKDTSTSAIFKTGHLKITGNLGISKQPGAKLEIAGDDTSTPLFKLSSSPATDGDVITVTKSGLVGIGVTNPSNQLEVSGIVTATAFVGDGSGLTGLGNTGGLVNNDTTTIGADENNSGTGEISFQINSLAKMTIDNEGQVGIGVVDAAEALDVVGNIKVSGTVDGVDIAALDSSSLKKDGTVALTGDWDIGDTRKIKADAITARDGAGLSLQDDGSNGILIEDGGNVGIGTDNPASLLHMESTSNPTLNIRKGAQGTTGTESGNIQFWAQESGGAPVVGAKIAAVSEEDWGVSAHRTSLYFYTAQDILSDPAMSIKAVGRVGIGTSDPSHLLDVKGGDIGVDGNNWFGARTGNMGWYGYTPVGDNLTIDNNTATLQGGVISHHGARKFSIVSTTDPTGVGYTSEMTFYNSNVGIGISPGTGAKLEVNGFTKLGSDSPAIKLKTFTGTLNASACENITINIAAEKILMAYALVNVAGSHWVPPGYETTPSYYYDISFESSGAQNMGFCSKGANTFNNLYRVTIMYIE